MCIRVSVCKRIMMSAVVVIGFERTLYPVSEDDMEAVLVARVLSGTLSSPVEVVLTTDDGTALGIHYSLAMNIINFHSPSLSLTHKLTLCVCVYI